MIDKEKYIEICNSCDQLLKDSDSSVQRISISWLHVIREHPIILSRYEQLFSNKNSFKYTKRLVTAGINYSRIIYNLVRSISNNSKIVELGEFEENMPIDYLFVSHLIEGSQINRESDFYFGNIISSLESENHKTITLLFNQTKIHNNDFKKKYSLPSRKIFLSNFLNFKDEINLFFQLWRERKTLKNKLDKFRNKSLHAEVIKETTRHCISNSTIGNLRRYYQFKKVIAKYKPRNVVTTFEGHAWERMLFCAAKEHSLSIQCMGYQHTSLFRFQHSVLRKLSSLYNPDVILTTGQFAKKRFENSDIGLDKKILILGSGRGNDLISTEGTSKGIKNSCIVIPEGFESECIILFRFSILCSKSAPEINFILKLHPIMNKETFVRKWPEFRSLPTNVRWASNNIYSDFNECSWALYRGTTMIVQAFYKGLIPLYLRSRPDEMSLDLLDEVSQHKMTISSVDDFLTSVSTENRCVTEREHIMNFCDSLYSKFDPEILKNLSKLSKN